MSDLISENPTRSLTDRLARLAGLAEPVRSPFERPEPAKRNHIILNQLQTELAKGVVEMKQQLSGKFEDDEIEGHLDGIFGPLRLSERYLLRPKNEGHYKLSEDELELSARVQQTAAHYLFYASSPDAKPESAQLMYHVYKTMGQIAQKNFGASTEFNRVWSGIKSQARVMKIMNELGFDISQPDYKIQLDEKNLHSPKNEIYWWDLKSGVDFIAVKDGQAYLVDAKGQRYYSEGATIYATGYKGLRDISSVTVRPQNFANLCHSLQNFIRKQGLDTSTIQSCTIVVPSQKTWDQPIDKTNLSIESPEQAKQKLIKFMTLPQQNRDEVERKLMPVKQDKLQEVTNRIKTFSYAH